MMNAPIVTANNKIPSGTPRPIPSLLVFDRPWLTSGVDVGVVGCVVSEVPTVARDVELTVVDDVILIKLYKAGDGSLVYLFDTPNRILVILSPYDSWLAVNGWSMKLQPLSM
jgi:hypothetical protein